MRALILAASALVATGAIAAIVITPADTSQCAKVSPVTTSKDIAALQADADCFGRAAAEDKAAADAYNAAAAKARASQKYRLDRIAELKAAPPPPPPEPVKCPDGSSVIPPATCPVPPPPPPPTGKIENKVASEGDSISVYGGYQYPSLYDQQRSAVSVCGLAVGGSNIITMTSRISGVTNCNGEVVTVLIGANDLLNYSSGQAWADALWNYTDQLRAKGFKVAVSTLLPRIAGSATNQAPFNARRVEVNNMIRASVGTHSDAVIDYAADPRIGDDDDAKNTALYPDGLHPSGAAHAILAEIYGPVVDRLLAQNGPSPVPTAPTPTEPTTGLSGLPPIASNFDPNTALLPSSIPGTAAPDTVGAFRFICGAGQLSYDDPILFPGQPGKSHLHQYYGNVTADAHSTYASLRAAGDSTCNWTGNGNAANRSAYWMPAMLDGKGNVVRPFEVSIYYKQRPANDPIVSDPANPKYRGKAVQLPNGLKFIFGWDPTGKNSIKTGGAWFNCKNVKYSTLSAAMANCGAGTKVGAIIEAPECWDGKNLDSPDHRSHVAYASYGTWGYLKCPSTHPYVIPTFTLGAWYQVQAGDNGALWELSSDHMAPGQPKGHTFHADFFMAWDPTVHNIWWQNCVNKLLNCSGGQLGDGQHLKGAASHNLKRDFGYSTRLVPVP